MSGALNHASPLPRLLLLLSATTGLVDAASVLGLGKVFTANMTGNVVFLGFAISGAPAYSPLPFSIALIAFLAGAVIAGRLGRLQAQRALKHWLWRAALFEAACLAAAGLIALKVDIARQQPVWGVLTVIALTAISMGFRNATVRQFKVPDLTTTVLTLTLTGLAADSRLAGGTGAHSVRRLSAVALMLAGAVVGAWLVLHFGLCPPLMTAAACILIATALHAGHPGASKPLSI